MSQKLYMVGQQKPSRENPTYWEFQGIFSAKNRAILACRNRNYFYVEIMLNENLPDETIGLCTVFPIGPLETMLTLP